MKNPQYKTNKRRNAALAKQRKADAANSKNYIREYMKRGA